MINKNKKYVKKRSILVLGLERTGTRIVTKMIINGGAYGDDSHNQPLDFVIDGKKNLNIDNNIIVLRRSFPHDRKYYSIERLIKRLKEIGYPTSHIVITNRDYHFVIKSQQASDKILPYPSGINNRYDLYQQSIISLYSEIPFINFYSPNTQIIQLSYEALVQYPQYISKQLKETLSLPNDIIVNIVDGNKKYVEKGD